MKLRTTNGRQQRCRPVLLLVLASLGGTLLLAGCGGAPTAAPPVSPRATAAVPTEPPGGQPATPGTPATITKPQGKLSARLELLSDPAVSAQDPEAQAQALNLPAHGPGSLMRNNRGEILVVIRLHDLSEANLTALQNAGASIVNTAEELRTVTAYVPPARLNDLAAIPDVENVREELQPA